MFGIKPQTQGDGMSEETMIVKSDRMNLVAKALSSKSRLMILRLLFKEDIDITRLAERMGMTAATVSDHINILAEVGLININYKPGGHGVRKVCSANSKHIVFKIR